MKLKNISLEKLESIKPGDEFSSAKALIEHLGLAYKSGNAGIKQRKDLHSLFDCTQEPGKRKILIKDTYPLEVIQANFELSNKEEGKLADFLIISLIDYHMTDDSDDIIVTNNSLAAHLTLGNKTLFNNIFYDESRRKGLASALNIVHSDLSKVNQWIDSTNDSFRYTINKSLERLEKSRLVIPSSTYVMNFPDEDHSVGATPEEERLILKIERDLLLEMGFDNISEVFLSKKQRKFYEVANKRVQELIGCESYYKAHRLRYNKDSIKAFAKEIKEEVGQMQERSNALSVERMTVKADRKHARLINSVQFGKEHALLEADHEREIDVKLINSSIILGHKKSPRVIIDTVR